MSDTVRRTVVFVNCYYYLRKNCRFNSILVWRRHQLNVENDKYSLIVFSHVTLPVITTMSSTSDCYWDAVIYYSTWLNCCNGSRPMLLIRINSVHAWPVKTTAVTFVLQFTVSCRRTTPCQYLSGTEDSHCLLLPLYQHASNRNANVHRVLRRRTRRQTSQQSATSGDDDVDAAVAGALVRIKRRLS